MLLAPITSVVDAPKIVIFLLVSLIVDMMQYKITFIDPSEPDKMTADGIMRFLDDLMLSPDSKLVLIIAWKFKAATQCEFTREEFISGMIELG